MMINNGFACEAGKTYKVLERSQFADEAKGSYNG